MRLFVILLCGAFSVRRAELVRFRLGMKLQNATSSVHIAGSFNNWDPTVTKLSDIDGDGSKFEVVLSLDPGTYEFKFINGNSWTDAEEVPWACSEQKSGHFNRFLSVKSNESADVDVCFSACVPCEVLPPCKLFTCPPSMVHRQSELDTIATLSGECCEYSSPFNKDVVVRSAGWSDGNNVSFWLNGKVIFATSRRGLTVIRLSIEGEPQEPQTFDTNMNSVELEAFLESVPSNTTILLGASDEASQGLSPRAQDLIESFGGRRISHLTWRGSYALIGVKNGSAFAEAITESGEGMAVAVGIVPWIELPPTEGLEWCDARAAIPATKGKLHSSGNLEIHATDGNCRYPVFEADSVKTCLRGPSGGPGGAWVVVLGTSNAQLLANTLLFMLADEAALSHIHFGEYNFHDFVIENGTISYHNVIRIDDIPPCKQNTTGPTTQEQECQEIFAGELSKAPAPSSERIRVTMTISFFWERVRSMMDIVEADEAWKDVKVGYVTQVVAWYLVCQNIKSYLCPRTELKSETEDEVFAKFADEMDMALNHMERSCSTGRAAQGFGCVVGTNSYTEAQGSLIEAFRRFNAEVMRSMTSRATPMFRALDFFQLGEAMPRETIAGHGSQTLHLWLWMLIFGGWCHEDLASRNWHVEFHGQLCSAEHVDPIYCPRITYGVEWHCMNSIPCMIKASPELTTSTTLPAVVPVTFKLDMSNEVVSAMGVHVAGSFQLWDPAATPLGLNQDLIYEATVYLSPGSYEYKFVNGDSWGGEEQIPTTCGLGEFSNRIFSVKDTPVVLEACFGSCLPCDASGTSLTVSQTGTKTATSTITRTTTTTLELFLPVDGGIDRACRGASAGDNHASYFQVIETASLGECKLSCLGASPDCVGIEYSLGRCEIWTRSEGIQASISLSGFQCYKRKRADPTFSYFHPVDGATNRACRGEHPGDNLQSYYDVLRLQSLEECQEHCVSRSAAPCVGIEYSLGRCEVWHRPEGIHASIQLQGFVCQSYEPPRRLAKQRFLRG